MAGSGVASWKRRRDSPEAWLARPEVLELAVPSGREPSRDGDERKIADDARGSPVPPVPPPPPPAPGASRLSIAIIEIGRESERDDEDAGISEDAAVPAAVCLVLAQVMVVDSTRR